MSVESAAIAGHYRPIQSLLWNNESTTGTKTSSRAEFIADEIRVIEQRMVDPKNHYLKITTKGWLEKEEMVGWGLWMEVDGRSEEDWPEFYKNRRRPVGCNLELLDATGGVRILKRAKIIGDRNY
jgi:hypothetical protein